MVTIKEMIALTFVDVGEAGIKEGVFKSYRNSDRRDTVHFIYDLAQKKEGADMLTISGYPDGSSDESFKMMVGIANEKSAMCVLGANKLAQNPYDAEELMRVLQGVMRRV